MARFDYVAVGHVSVDVLLDAPEGEHRQAGGGALYSGLQAARLGLRTLIITRGRREELEPLIEPFRDELQLQMLDAPHSTTFQTRGIGEGRTQRVASWAGPLPSSALPRHAAIVHLAPVARETPSRLSAAAELVGITPQGLMRRWDETGTIEQVSLRADALPKRCDAMVVSAAERECLGAAASARASLLAITAGSEATQIRLPGGRMASVPPPQLAELVDDLGAGDVFAAAFFAALHGGLAPTAAVAFGNAAAAVRLGGCGPDAIGDRKAIEAVLARRSRGHDRDSGVEEPGSGNVGRSHDPRAVSSSGQQPG